MKYIFLLLAIVAGVPARAQVSKTTEPKIIHFKSGALELGGELFMPSGKGPFPALLYNHGSAPGMLNSEASKTLGPLFASRGWVFFMPYRRGQGLSAAAGSYIGDEIKNASKTGGEKAAAVKMIQLLQGEQLDDQMAALHWLKEQSYVQKNKIAVAGNSFGGIEVVLGAAQESYCAAIDASGAAESWGKSPELQNLLKQSVRKSKSPMFFFQAENDFNLEPSKVLSSEMKAAGKISEMKIYPPFGKTNKDGHSFAYLGSSIWIPDIIQFLQKHCL
jgi:carboxymethylenebutenolidase